MNVIGMNEISKVTDSSNGAGLETYLYQFGTHWLVFGDAIKLNKYFNFRP